MQQSFPVIGVKVTDGYVRSLWGGTIHGRLSDAEVTFAPEGKAHRVAGSVAATVALSSALGPLPLLGMLGKRDRATIYITFTSGYQYRKTIKGNFAVRDAHGEALKLAALVRSAQRSTR